MAGVLSRQPLDKATVSVPRGRIYIIPERCKGCKFCIDFCPRDVLVETSEMNARGYHYPVVAEGKEDECVACQFCSILCPEFAIYSEEIVEEENVV